MQKPLYFRHIWEANMQGIQVLVRGFRDLARVCRVVTLHDSTVQLTDEQGFNEIQQWGCTERIVTFRLSDVFAYDKTVKNEDCPDWSRLTPVTEILVATGIKIM
jgi:hypothetical protein